MTSVREKYKNNKGQMKTHPLSPSKYHNSNTGNVVSTSMGAANNWARSRINEGVVILNRALTPQQ